MGSKAVVLARSVAPVSADRTLRPPSPRSSSITRIIKPAFRWEMISRRQNVKAISCHLQVGRVPELDFALDETPDKALRREQLFAEEHAEDPDEE